MAGPPVSIGASHQSSRGSPDLAAAGVCAGRRPASLVERLFRYQALYEAPKGNEPPHGRFARSWWHLHRRQLLSWFKTTGKRAWASSWLILIGTVPTAYALNHNVSPAECRALSPLPSRRGRFSNGMCHRHARSRSAHRDHPTTSTPSSSSRPRFWPEPVGE